MGDKIDFRKTLKDLYNPRLREFQILDIPAMSFLMIDGCGDPNVAVEYQQALEGLYALSYGIKFSSKQQGTDYVVPPLEGLWWMDDMSEFTMANRARWKWTMMIMQPEWITPGQVERVKDKVITKKKIPTILDIAFETYLEGMSVQILFTGAYKDEAPVIAEMHKFIRESGFAPNGKHHEIYLSDPRKTPVEKLHTILRQPIQKA